MPQASSRQLLNHTSDLPQNTPNITTWTHVRTGHVSLSLSHTHTHTHTHIHNYGHIEECKLILQNRLFFSLALRISEMNAHFNALSDTFQDTVSNTANISPSSEILTYFVIFETVGAEIRKA